MCTGTTYVKVCHTQYHSYTYKNKLKQKYIYYSHPLLCTLLPVVHEVLLSCKVASKTPTLEPLKKKVLFSQVSSSPSGLTSPSGLPVVPPPTHVRLFDSKSSL